MLKNYLTKAALVIANIPFSLGLVIILERKLQFYTPGSWVVDRISRAVQGKDFGLRAWMGFGVDYVLCFAVVWVLWLMFRSMIREVERRAE